MSDDRTRLRGLLLVFFATLLWSSVGFFVRLLHLDVWTVLGWRSFFGAIGLFAIMVWQYGRGSGRAMAGLSPFGLVAIPVSAVSMFAYVASLTLTDVANVMTIYATVPFVAAGIAFLWIGERPSRRVVIASAVSFCGIALMAVTAVGGSDMRGNALAFLMTLGFAFILVLARREPNLPMAPVNLAGALICFAASLPLMPSLWPTPEQFLVLAVFGLSTNALAYILFLTGGRDVPSGEASLITLLDVVLGPLWVYLAFNEVPSRMALVATATVLGATVWYVAGLRPSRPQPA